MKRSRSIHNSFSERGGREQRDQDQPDLNEVAATVVASERARVSGEAHGPSDDARSPVSLRVKRPIT